MADLIATEAYAWSISNRNTPYTSNLGCTKSRAIALGCNVKGTYTDNLLVREEDLSTDTYSLKNITSDYLSNVRILAGSCIFTGNLVADGVLYTTATPSGSSWTITINGSTSTTYMVYPTPNSTIHSYKLSKKDYSYNISISSPTPLANNLTRVFILSNMDNSLVGTKNYISTLGISSNYIIYTKTNSPGSIGSFIGNQCTNLDGPRTMINGSTYSVLYTEIDTSNDAYSSSLPAGIITTAWRRVHTFQFNSSIYYYSFNINV